MPTIVMRTLLIGPSFDLACVWPTKRIVIPALASLVIGMKAVYALDKEETNFCLLPDKSHVRAAITGEQFILNKWTGIFYTGITWAKTKRVDENHELRHFN